MRRFVLFLFPTLVFLAAAGLLATIQRSETLKAQISRWDVRDWMESVFGTETEEVVS